MLNSADHQYQPRTLVFCSAGVRIKSLSWLPDIDKFQNIDTAIAYYGEQYVGTPQGVKYFLRKKDYKFPNFIQLVRSFPDTLAYDMYIFIDDDIKISAEQIETWRRLAHQHELDISQPSLTPESKADWPHVIKQPGIAIDIDQFVEIQCFALSTRALRIALPYFFMVKTGTGLDVALYQLSQRWKLSSAVLHEVSVTHPHRPENQTIRAQFEDFSQFNAQMMRMMNFCFYEKIVFEDIVASSRILGNTRPAFVRWFSMLRFVLNRIHRAALRLIYPNRSS